MSIKLNQTIPVSIQKDYNSNNPKWNINYWWGDGKYFINENDSKQLQSLVEIIKSQTKVTPKKGDIIYASKASEIPRFKLKEFIKDNNLKKTSRVGYASIVIINKGYFNELIKKLKNDEVNFIREDAMKQVLNNSKSNTNTNIRSIFDKAIDKDKVGFVRIENHLKDLFKNFPATKAQFDLSTYKIKGITIDLYRENRLLELLNIIINNDSLIQSGKMKFVFDEELFVEMNKEGIELDDDYLKTLRDMLFSSDKSNVKLGFEMMSNLVINQPTLLSMSFLLNELYHQTNFRPSYFASSNSNLKSLLKVFKTKGIYWERDWKTFGTGLRLNFKDGKEGEIVKQFLLDNINREFKLSNSAAESLVDIVFTTETK